MAVGLCVHSCNGAISTKTEGVDKRWRWCGVYKIAAAVGGGWGQKPETELLQLGFECAYRNRNSSGG